jgi:signal transduction histidine kinase
MATILIVDDREMNRKLLTTLLGRSGHRLVEAGDGAEALHRVRADRPDLVITDVLMPRMDGYEFVRRLRAEPDIAATRVIFYTAHFREHEAVDLAKSCGVTEVLVKPSPLERILLAVDQALARTPEPPPALPQAFAEQFDREHLRLITDKLAERATSLRTANERLRAEVALRERSESEVRRVSDSLERQVGERTLELERANRELEGFAHSVSHDLRAPLRHIDGYARLLEESAALDATSVKYLDTIAKAARHMGELIDGLLALSRVGRVGLRKRPIDMRQMVHGLQRQLANVGDGLAECWNVEALPSAMGDPVLLELVWTNLLSNAMKFSSRQEKPAIEIGAQAGSEGETVFFVRDNGVGFDQKLADRLFKPFQRLHAADEFDGIGIGLATVRRIVERHGGRAWAEGRIGAGATFYFTLGPEAAVRSEVSAA